MKQSDEKPTVEKSKTEHEEIEKKKGHTIEEPKVTD